MSYFILKAILAMCSLNIPASNGPRNSCVEYMTECVHKVPGFTTEAEKYIQCQYQYMTIYNSYASFVCPTYEQLKERREKYMRGE